MTAYQEFLKRKQVSDTATGLQHVPALNPMLFPHQCDMTKWALRRGRAALFADCGLGKTPMALEWAEKQPHDCIIVAPLAVAHQFIREANKFGVDAGYAKDQSGITKRITVTNYERLENFHIDQFGAVALDESSILKNSSGAYSTWMIDAFKNTPFRLCQSATPAPNDVMELGTQAEFLGVMTRSEMLAMYFTHDGGDTSKWRVKGHAQRAFWEWMATWAVMIRKPSDLGYSDDGFVLPPLHMHERQVSVETATSGFLFALEAQTLQERQQARRESISDRVKACADLINGEKLWEIPAPGTGKNTTQQTASNAEQTSVPLITGTKKQDKRQIKDGSQTLIKKNSESGIDSITQQISTDTKQTEKHISSSYTGLPNMNFAQCSNPKKGNAQFANVNHLEIEDSISTTITKQDQSEASCVTHAINCLEDTRTINQDLSMQDIQNRLNTSKEQWIVWTNLNEESRLVAASIHDAVEVTGSDSDEHKERTILGFLDGSIRVIVSKPKIIGLGLNLQNCHNMAFVGLSDSYEQLYQSIRRCWRFGQTKPVNVYVITAETEGAVVSNIKRKEREAEETYNSMIEHMKDLNAAALHGGSLRNKTTYHPDVPMVLPSFLAA